MNVVSKGTQLKLCADGQMRKMPSDESLNCACLPRYVKDFLLTMDVCIANCKARKSRRFPCVVCLEKTDSVEKAMFSFNVHDDGMTFALGATCKRIGVLQHVFDACVCCACLKRVRDQHEMYTNISAVGLFWRVMFPECRLFQFFATFHNSLIRTDAEYRSSICVIFAEYTTVSRRGVSCANEACGAHEVQDRAFHCCGRCRSVHYCRRKCQHAHWLAGHRQECQAAPAPAVVAAIPATTGLMYETD
jgi:hypothetical protein